MLTTARARPRVPAAGLARDGRGAAGAVLTSSLLLAMLIALVGGLFGAEALVVLLLFGVPAIALLVDLRVALFLFIMLMPYIGSEAIPREAQNAVFFGTAALFVVRLLLARALAGRFDLPLPRPLVLYAALFTLATAIGVTHLDEITYVFLKQVEVGPYGIKEYVVGVYARRFTLIIMAVVIIWLLVTGRSRPDWIVNAALASGAAFVLMMIGVVAMGGFSLADVTSRVYFMVLGRQSNSLGGLLMILLASSLYMWELSQGAWRRIVLMTLTAMLLTGVVLSASRGAIMATLFIFLWYVIEFRRMRALFFGVLLLVAMLALAPDAVQDRMLRGLADGDVSIDTSQGFNDPLTSGRLYIWSRLAPEILQHPLFGGGLLSTQWTPFARSGEYFATHPHSLYLGILLDTGLVGAAVMVIFFRYLWRSFRALGRDERLSPHLRGYFRGASVALAAYLVFGIPNGYWFPSQDQAFLWIAIGLAIGLLAVLGPAPAAEPAKPAKRSLQGHIARPWLPARR
jgi:O-antigen ligase